MITGASGLLGRALMKEFSAFDVHGVVYSRLPEGDTRYHRCDLTDVKAMEALYHEICPELVIHAAAERKPDRCENEQGATEALNVGTTAALARLVLGSKGNCFLLVISTDYVFDGTQPPYKPNAPTNPLNYYGVTKRDAEDALWKSGHTGGVLRVPILFGPVENLNESSPTSLVPQLLAAKESGTPVKVDDWAVRWPTHVDDVARACRRLCERRLRHCMLSGTWHFAGPVRTTKYGMALDIAKYLGVPPELVIADGAPPAGAARPKDCTLDTTALCLMGICKASEQKVFADTIGDIIKPHL
mmetsp:Transcript_18818/g.47862  ORF Transcript_18818/g.47862 Transcript_18818/m.47862 type:complete len:301 (+) Transcript_18818:2-904(+)